MLQNTSYSMNSYRHLPYGEPHAVDHPPSDTGRDAISQASLAPPVQPNGYPMITESCKRDFFTIRADCVQDAALASVDSLAEYLVWDGMDRRARAIASASHTSSPEVVVSISQIAADIKSRLGHDLCERTIERAIRKLSDTGLIGIESRFNAGRRQASSYRLLFSDGMKLRLDHTRRGKKATTGYPDEHQASTVDKEEYPPSSQQTRTERKAVRSDNTSMAPNYTHGLARIGVKIPSFPQPAVDSDISPRSDPSEHICTQAMPDALKHESALTDTDGNKEVTDNSNALDENIDCGLQTNQESVHGNSALIHQPTSVSPLFNKEEKNKKGFENVFSFSDFSKKNNSSQPSPERGEGNGYFLDSVHRKGWVSVEEPQLLAYLGDLSRYAFFSGHHTLDELSVWFQSIEDDIANNRTSLGKILHTAGITNSTTPLSALESVATKGWRFGC